MDMPHRQGRIRPAAESGAPYAPHDLRPAPRIIDVFPSEHLGNFFTGTLWFSGSKARRLMQIGEQDMRQLIARLIAEDDPDETYYQDLSREATNRIRCTADDLPA